MTSPCVFTSGRMDGAPARSGAARTKTWRMWESKFSACLSSRRRRPVWWLISMPQATSVALSEARVWPMEQMPQMRLVTRATSV